jgi:hypothetical protein
MKYTARVLTVAAMASFGCGVLPSTGFAQQAEQGAEVQLPPALRAAVQSGNAAAVQQAIATLSGGNATQAANLADNVVKAAERLFASNPQAAIQAASGAVNAISSSPVQSAAPRQSQDVITTAARLFILPAAQQLNPTATAALATATMAAAATSGNSALVASTAAGAVSVAEKMLATNPAGAVALAGATVQAVNTQAVMSGQPSQALQVVTTAARIVVSPEAEKAAPAGCAQVAIGASTVATNPSVYASSPSGAIAVMSNSYATVTSQAVTASSPGATATVTGTLNQASSSPLLASSNPTNSGDVARILAKQVAAPKPTQDQSQPVNPVRTTTPVFEENKSNSASAT